MPRFTQYKTFIAILDTGSLSAAGRALNITPSAVSKQLTLLEEAVKVQLIERSNRKIQATAAGNLFYQQCKKILHSVSDAEEMLLDANNAISGKLSITLSKSLARSRLFEVLAEFSSHYPDILFNIHMSDQVEDLHEQDIDFAFRLGRLSDSSRLYGMPLMPVNLICCGTQNYIDRLGRPNTLGDLKDHSVMLLMPKNLSEQLRLFFKQENIALDRRNSHITNDVEGVYQSVRSGMNLGMLLDISISDELESGTLIDIFPEQMLPSKWLFLVSKEQGFNSHKHLLFKRFIKEKLAVNALVSIK